MTEPDLEITQLWQWVCHTCRDPEDPNVPGAYGVGDTYGEIAAEVAAHKRARHPEVAGVTLTPEEADRIARPRQDGDHVVWGDCPHEAAS